MPCFDGREEDDRREAARERAFVEAALCGLLTGLENSLDHRIEDPFDLIDYEEAGINRQQLKRWWLKHKSEDVMRRAREAQELKEKELRMKVLAKLTPEEKKLLNLR